MRTNASKDRYGFRRRCIVNCVCDKSGYIKFETSTIQISKNNVLRAQLKSNIYWKNNTVL